MKYKVVKDNGAWGCLDCVNCLVQRIPGGDKCKDFMEANNLPNCLDEKCHFEEIDEITDVDLREIDEARDGRYK